MCYMSIKRLIVSVIFTLSPSAEQRLVMVRYHLQGHSRLRIQSNQYLLVGGRQNLYNDKSPFSDFSFLYFLTFVYVTSLRRQDGPMLHNSHT